MAPLRTLLFVASILAAACDSPTSPGPESRVVSVNGSVLYFNLEGGFWAVQGDDGIVYEPMNGLASQFRRANLRVAMVAKLRNDLGGIHMVGPIVEIISIHTRELSTGFPVIDPRR